MTDDVRLRRTSDRLLNQLLEAAVGDANPEEVMPPLAGTPGWTTPRRSAFREFHRARLAGFEGHHRTVNFVIMWQDRIVGVVRLTRTDQPDTLETGLWLARSARGHGVGTAALRAALAEAIANGAVSVIADTPDNLAALAMLRRCDATLAIDTASGRVHALIRLPRAGR